VAPRIETSATRRQLLEYGLAFDVDGVVLVDAEAERVRTITFRSRARSSRLVWIAVGIALGIAATLALGASR
jgi:hypothetical protein